MIWHFCQVSCRISILGIKHTMSIINIVNNVKKGGFAKGGFAKGGIHKGRKTQMVTTKGQLNLKGLAF